MVRPVAGRTPRQPPLSWVKEGDWPDGKLREDAPPSAALIQGIAYRLKEALKFGSTTNPERVTARKAAEASGVAPSTISNIIKGTTSPDADTVARLEEAFDIDLWGNEHRSQHAQQGEDGATAGYSEYGKEDDEPDDDEPDDDEFRDGGEHGDGGKGSGEDGYYEDDYVGDGKTWLAT